MVKSSPGGSLQEKATDSKKQNKLSRADFVSSDVACGGFPVSELSWCVKGGVEHASLHSNLQCFCCHADPRQL